MALADAGLEMKDLVGAIAVGKVDDKIVVDLQYEEEAYEGEVADIPIAMIPSTEEVTLLQMDGPITKEELLEAINKARDVIRNIVDIQRKAIKEKYERLVK